MARPTLEWKRQLEAGNSFCSEKAIIDSDKLLDSYLSALKKAFNDIEIWDTITHVVKGFDELNIKHNYFIVTPAREELAGFIQSCAEAAGFNFDGDVTEEWRVEW